LWGKKEGGTTETTKLFLEGEWLVPAPRPIGREKAGGVRRLNEVGRGKKEKARGGERDNNRLHRGTKLTT